MPGQSISLLVILLAEIEPSGLDTEAGWVPEAQPASAKPPRTKASLVGAAIRRNDDKRVIPFLTPSNYSSVSPPCERRLAAPHGLLGLGLTDEHYQQLYFGKETAAGAANILAGNGLNQRIALVDIVDSEIFDLNIEEIRRYFAGSIEPQGIGADQEALGLFELVRGRTLGGHAFYFGNDDFQGFGDAIVAGRNTAEEQPGMLERSKITIDRIGKPAFFPHLAEEPGFEAATAEDMVEDKGGDEVGIGALQSDAAEGDDGLRYLHFDRLGGAEPPRLRIRHRCRIVARRQASESAIDKHCDLCRVDVSDYRDSEIGARQHAADIGPQTIHRDRRNRFERALRRTRVWMAGKRAREPTIGRDVGRIGRAPPELREHRRAYALEFLPVEARRGQGEAQQLEGLVAIFGERADRAAQIVAVDAEGEADGPLLQAFVKRRRGEIAGTFVEQPSDEVGDAGLGGGILCRSAEEGEFERHHGQVFIAHQPNFDSGRRHDAFDPGSAGEGGSGGNEGECHGYKREIARHERFSGGAGCLMR